MQKRKLDIDHLRVDSFETGDAAEVRGTVHAHATEPTACNQATCGFRTCWDSCDINATCGLSCNPSCIATDGFCCPES
jgi:hypothetical protein